MIFFSFKRLPFKDLSVLSNMLKGYQYVNTVGKKNNTELNILMEVNLLVNQKVYTSLMVY